MEKIYKGRYWCTAKDAYRQTEASKSQCWIINKKISEMLR